ncbi:MAG: hypothetical protein EOO53_16870 [Gammaproteobacteria bacterium]|nr:MAG: hypothetical protein EOO53_16870 [Gammaproteobacteria bacterium]
MKKNLGFTSFEFYFVMAAIGLVVLIGIQRYLQLAEETKRFSFEIAANNFNAAVYNYHARWLISRKDQARLSEANSVQANLSQANLSKVNIDGKNILFSEKGWPLAVDLDLANVSLKTCLSLWNNFLQNSPSISYEGSDLYGTRAYHLSLPDIETCRFEFITDHPQELYFDYLPASGDMKLNTPPVEKK